MKTKRFDWKAFVFFLLYTLALGGLGAILGGDMDLDRFTRPPLTPPEWVFPIVWTVLYVLMAIGAYLIYASHDIDREAPLRLYLLQVIVNVLWPLFFFRLESRLFAFGWLLLLLLLVIMVAVAFRPISKTAFYLLLPYIAWLIFAGYLNLAFYLLNR